MDINSKESNEALISGIACWVRVGNSASDAQDIGFVDNFNATKDINLQEANCVGVAGPVSIDAVGVKCSLNLSGFLATKSVYSGTETIRGMGKVSLASFNPDDDAFYDGQVVTKFPYIDFYNKKTKTIVASFKTCIAQSYKISGSAGQYLKIDTSMRAIKMSSGKDYLGSK